MWQAARLLHRIGQAFVFGERAIRGFLFCGPHYVVQERRDDLVHRGVNRRLEAWQQQDGDRHHARTLAGDRPDDHC